MNSNTLPKDSITISKNIEEISRKITDLLDQHAIEIRDDLMKNIMKEYEDIDTKLINDSAAEIIKQDQIVLLLAQPDYTTANRVASAINSKFGIGTAKAHDASSVEIAASTARQGNLVSFLTTIENISVEPDQRARVVVNERNGTVIAGGDVRISAISISHGDLKVSISTENLVSQPSFVSTRGSTGIRTEVVPNTRIEVHESESGGMVTTGGNTVAELVRALSKIKTSTRDIISILQGIKTAGALHAELIIQ